MDAVDVVIAIAIGVSIMALGRWGVKLLATPASAEPDPDDIVDVERPFRCSVCGMRLTVTHAQGEDVAAPRHCREEMEAV
jgi:hypothetical protein